MLLFLLFLPMQCLGLPNITLVAEVTPLELLKRVLLDIAPAPAPGAERDLVERPTQECRCSNRELICWACGETGHWSHCCSEAHTRAAHTEQCLLSFQNVGRHFIEFEHYTKAIWSICNVIHQGELADLIECSAVLESLY